MSAAKITVIIPAFNEEKLIDLCLESLAQQRYQDFQALIVNDASTDATREHIMVYEKKTGGRIRLKEYGKVGPGRARNLAARETSSEILAFMDADCVASASWLENLVQAFENPSVASAGGPHLAPPDSSAFQLEVEKFFKRVSPSIGFYKTEVNAHAPFETNHNPLCNVAYRRDLFLKLGGFREDLFPGEDVELDFKVKAEKLRIMYDPRAFVYHYRPETILQFRKVMHAYGRAQGKLVREYGIKRRIQIMGLGALVLLIAAEYELFMKGGSVGSLSGLLLLWALFLWRPEKETALAIRVNSLQWIAGFLEGMLTNRSDPPGATLH